MPETDREAYLAELERLLPFPADRRAEILEEIGAHLDDATADGLSEARAQARLGTPVDLARELARPEQTRMRLLAAAGAGVRAAIGPWVYGYLLASVVVFMSIWTLSAILMLLSSLVARDLAIGIDGGWTTAATAAPIAVGLYFAGRASTSAAAIAARRVRSDIAPWAALVGTTISAAILLFVWETPQNAVSVAALAVAPLGTTVGAYRPNLISPWPRVAPIAALGAAVLLIGLGVLTYFVAPPSVSYGEEVPADTLEERTAIVGPTWGATDDEPLFSSWGTVASGGVIEAEWHLAWPGRLAGFNHLRLEAWHAQDSAEWLFDPVYHGPFAIGSVEMSDGILKGRVVTDRDPDVHAWLLVLTGRGPDGVRYVLDASASGQSTFTGTAWDWIVAVAD